LVFRLCGSQGARSGCVHGGRALPNEPWGLHTARRDRERGPDRRRRMGSWSLVYSPGPSGTISCQGGPTSGGLPEAAWLGADVIGSPSPFWRGLRGRPAGGGRPCFGSAAAASDRAFPRLIKYGRRPLLPALELFWEPHVRTLAKLLDMANPRRGALRKTSSRRASEAQCRAIRERGLTLSREVPRFEVLRKRLLRKGGLEVVLRPEPHLDLLLSRGKFKSADNVTFVQGDPGNCHGNSARCWLSNTAQRSVVVGFAMSEGQLWRQHTWVEEKGRVIETTEPRVLYFGARLSPFETASFVPSNYPELGAFLQFMKRNNWFRDQIRERRT
jgi:hypothetical protein